MNYYSYFETQDLFKVKNPENFKAEFESLVEAEEKYLEAKEGGFYLVATNPWIKKPEKYESLDAFLQAHLLEGSFVVLHAIYKNSRNSEIDFSMSYITDLGVTSASSDELLTLLKNKHLPKQVKLKKDTFYKESGFLLKKEWDYVVTERKGNLVQVIANKMITMWIDEGDILWE